MDVSTFAALADETAAQLLARSCVDPVSTGVYFIGAVRAGHVLEISGPSVAAKTETLVQVSAAYVCLNCIPKQATESSVTQVAAACILPKVVGASSLGYEGVRRACIFMLLSGSAVDVP